MTNKIWAGPYETNIQNYEGFISTFDITHYKMHEGRHFFYKEVVAFTGGAADTKYFMFSVDSMEVHAKFLANADQEYDIYIYEGPTVTDNGTPITTINNNRNSSNTPTLLAYANPTATAGTLIWHGKVGIGRTGGVAIGLGYEIIAKSATKYLFKIVKVGSTTGWVDIDFFWYESEK